MKKIIYFVLAVLICLTSFSFTGCNTVEYGGDSATKYTISATYSDDYKTLSVECMVDYEYRGENSVSHLVFNMYPNLYREEGGETEMYGVHVDGVQTAFGERGEKGEYLDVALRRELFDGDRVEVVINYKLTLPESKGIYGYTETDTKISGWYPVLCCMERGEWIENEVGFGDYLYGEVGDYEIRLTTGKELQVASSGKRVGVVNGTDTVTYTYKAENIRDFAFCIGEYKTVSGMSGATMITVYSREEERASKILTTAKKAFLVYGELFGKYEYPTFSIADTEIDAGGMEFSGLVYINSEALGRELEEIVVHEIAHQWWYGMVGSNPTLCAWLDEGLSEYSVLEYIAEEYGELERNKIVKEKHDAYALFCSVEREVRGRGDCPMTQKTNKFNSLYEYVVVTYHKGCLFFENLGGIMGRTTLNKYLKRYVERYRYKTATPQDLQECLEESGVKLATTFRAWEEGKVIFHVA